MNAFMAAMAGIAAGALVLLTLLFLAGPPPHAIKGDRLPLPVTPAPLPAPLPKPVEARWPSWLRPATSIPVPDMPVEPVEPIREAAAEPVPIESRAHKSQRRSYAYDICRGKGRYYTNGGRSWRCNRK